MPRSARASGAGYCDHGTAMCQPPFGMPAAMRRTSRLGSPGSRGPKARVLAPWLLTVVLLGVISPAAAETLYLVPDGNDAWSGRRSDPAADRSDGPVASLKGARDAVRRMR